MARLVLLSIPENALAEQLVRNMIESPDIAHVVPSSATVEWVVARPTTPCQCALQNTETSGRRRSRRRDGMSRKSADAFTKGRRFGWWLHVACKKPTRLVVEAFARNMTNGAYDLLPEILGDGREPNDNRKWDENWRTKR